MTVAGSVPASIKPALLQTCLPRWSDLYVIIDTATDALFPPFLT